MGRAEVGLLVGAADLMTDVVSALIAAIEVAFTFIRAVILASSAYSRKACVKLPDSVLFLILSLIVVEFWLPATKVYVILYVITTPLVAEDSALLR